MKSFPEGPTATVVFFPRRTKVKTSPCYNSMLILVSSIRINGYGTNLFTVLLEEAGRIHAICNGASNEGDVVKDHGRLIGVREEQLVDNVENDGQCDEGTEQNRDLDPQSQSLELESERVAREFLKNAHIEGR